MFDQTQSGCILPEGLTVIATAFEKVVSARNISRDSDEADCLARRAISLYMNGTRNDWELEVRLKFLPAVFRVHDAACRQQRPGCGSATPLVGLGEKPDVMPRGCNHADRTNASTCDRPYSRVR